ncbi:sulfurtransferase [Sulfurospirillum arcachonense]|uniref:sulfurtransferase n=1 Tax=Sulfurospirillum arcachonense TaxID=57666 RepID=UPI00046A2DFE|nr:rhodanese-like domain-containing protein [Sulfurospirillum arcachonense]
MSKWYKIIFIAILSVNLSFAGDILISAKEAIKLINKQDVMFVSGDGADIFKTGHIKGSVEMFAHHLHHSDSTGHMHCAPLFMCPDEAEKYISSKGISNDTLVIAYDNFRGPNATGVYAFFKSWGHKNIKILDGGRSAIMAIDPQQRVYDKLKNELKALQKSKAPKMLIDETKDKMKKQAKKLLVIKGAEPKQKNGHYKIDTKKINYDYIASKHEVLDAVKDILKNGKDSEYKIIDTRGFTEVMGERKLDNVARGGHIPGAVFIEWKNITDFDKELSFQELDRLQKVFDKYGITKDKKIYAYCHVGAGRSSHIITALELLGYPNAKVYTGSWDEWGNDMNLPIRR